MPPYAESTSLIQRRQHPDSYHTETGNFDPRSLDHLATNVRYFYTSQHQLPGDKPEISTRDIIYQGVAYQDRIPYLQFYDRKDKLIHTKPLVGQRFAYGTLEYITRSGRSSTLYLIEWDDKTELGNEHYSIVLEQNPA